MKLVMLIPLIFATIETLVASEDPLRDMAERGGSEVEGLRHTLKYPIVPGENRTEYEARLRLLLWKDQGTKAGTWTPALEVEFQRQMTALAQASSQRQAAEAAARAAAASGQAPVIIIQK